MKYPIIILFPLLICFGCGKWPPIVESAKDITKLPNDQQSVRVRGLADSDLQDLEHLKNLSNLDFTGGWGVKEAKITDRGLLILSGLDLPHLDHLNLGHNKNITDDGLKHLVKMKSIIWLSLRACPNITDEGLKNIIPISNLSRGLDLRGCNGITDDGLNHIAKMKNLGKVLLGGCENITREAVEKLQLTLRHTKVEKDDNEWANSK